MLVLHIYLNITRNNNRKLIEHNLGNEVRLEHIFVMFSKTADGVEEM